MTVLAHSKWLLIFAGCFFAIYLGLRFRPKGAMDSDKLDAIGGASALGIIICIVVLTIRFVRFWMK